MNDRQLVDRMANAMERAAYRENPLFQPDRSFFESQARLALKIIRDAGNKVKKAKLSPLPPAWSPSREGVNWARANFPSVNPETETEKFVDHFKANGKRFIDWERAWKNWIRRASEFAVRGSGEAPETRRRRLGALLHSSTWPADS